MIKKLITKAMGLYLEAMALVSPPRAARTGFLLFCRPFRLKLTRKQIDFLYSADRFTLKHEGYQIQGYRWGSGERKILFVHGWQSHSYRWKPYIEALPKDQYTVYALDAPGHGLSSGNFLSVPLYSSLIERFLREHPGVHTVAGHSIGGFSLLHAFYLAPELRADRIILLATPGEATSFVSVFRDTLGLSARTVKLVTEHFVERYQVSPEFFSARRFAAGLKVRGLIIHDEDDAEAPYDHAGPISEAWGRARIVTTKGFGHNLKSPTVVKEVVRFIHEPVLQGSL